MILVSWYNSEVLNKRSIR